MELIGITLLQAEKFFIVLARVAAVVAVIPIFGHQAVPPRLRIGLAVFLSIIIFPLAPSVPENVSLTIGQFFVALFQSVCVGLVISFFVILIFAGVQFGGEIAGFEMGFSIISVIDPLSSSRMSLITQFQYIFSLLIFLVLDGHLFLIQGLVESFRTAPLLGVHFVPASANQLIRATSNIFVIGVKISAPIMVATLLAKVGLGILARTMPQLNVFIVGFPLQIGIGLITLVLSMPIFFYTFQKLWSGYQIDWFRFIRLF